MKSHTWEHVKQRIRNSTTNWFGGAKSIVDAAIESCENYVFEYMSYTFNNEV